MAYIQLAFVFILITCFAKADVRITKPTSSTTSVNAGQTLTLECMSDDESAMRWDHQGMPISQSSRKVISNRQEGKKKWIVLTIKNVADGDKGRYQCKNLEDIFDSADVTVTVTATTTTERDIEIVEPKSSTLDVVVGTAISLKCIGGRSAQIVWKHKGMPLTPSVKIIISQGQDAATGDQVSLLTVSDAGTADGGPYTCEDTTDIFNKDTVTVSLSLQSSRDVKIIEPSEDTLTLAAGSSLTLKCAGDINTKIRWKFNGMPLSTNGRIFITTAKDIDEDTVESIFTRMSLSTREQGNYVCQDESDPLNEDKIRVTVTAASSSGQKVKLVETATEVRLRVGESFTLKCQAAKTTQIQWYKNSSPASHTAFIINQAVNDQAGLSTSMLTKAAAVKADSAVYSCRNSRDGNDKDTVRVTVEDKSGRITGSETSPGESVPTSERPLVLGVGHDLRLQCSINSNNGRDLVPVWTKGDQILVPGPKYVITSNAQPSELKIRNTIREDAGIYKCSFKRKNDGTIAAMVVFNVTTLACPPISAPKNGSFDQCNPKPVFGERCSFKCSKGFKLSGGRSVSCDKNAEDKTFWRGAKPICKLANGGMEMEVPTSLSHVLLRVGWLLKLQCSEGASWSHNEQKLETGDKYDFEENALIVKDTTKADTGIYDCVIRQGDTNSIIGIKKFNVTSLPCPRLSPPINGSFQKCSHEPVYGQTCTFKCNPGFKFQSGSRSRTCELAHSESQVYWTGSAPMCKSVTFLPKTRRPDIPRKNISSRNDATTISLSCILFIATAVFLS